MDEDKFIFCLEGVPDAEDTTITETLKNLEHLAYENGVGSIYKTCDSIESFEESLNALLYDDHNFKNYEVIYLVMPGEANSVCLNDYHYSMDEIAEIFEGKMRGKIIHFANAKILDLTPEESQYFLDITGAKAISGYGNAYNTLTSSGLDRAFFSIFENEDNIFEIVEELHQKHYALCKLLDFRLYY
jgi:hypothetical protein